MVWRMFSCSAAGHVIVVGAAMALLAGGPAFAQSQSLGDALFARPDDGRRASAPPVARYVAETGSSFVFDRTAGARGLLRFEGSPEVWVLDPHTAPRGDVIYKNDQGEPMLRVTRLGGLTLFTPQQPDGAAVAMAGESAPLRLASLGANELLQRVRYAGSRASRAAQRRIEIEVQADSSSAALIADAAMVFSDAVIRLAQQADGRKFLQSFGKISIAEGKRPSVKIHRTVLEIRVAPQMGLAGRPSSEKIIHALGGEH